MWIRLKLFSVLLLLLVSSLSHSFSPNVHAQTTASVGVGDTILNISGQTSPNAFISVYRDANLIGTLTADNDGTFARSFPAQVPGITRLSVVARDSQNRLTDTATLEVNLQQHFPTAVYFFVPTSFDIESSTLANNEPLSLKGQTIPYGTVTLYVDGQSAGTVTAGGDGVWSYTFNAQHLSSGFHSVFARVHDDQGAQSYPTRMQSFFINRPLAPIPRSGSPTPLFPIRMPPVPSILSPSEGQKFDQNRVTITGQSMAGTQVEIWDDRQALSAVWTGVTGTWSVPYSFTEGNHTIRARSCQDGRCSGFSNGVSFVVDSSAASGRGGLRAYLEKSVITSLTEQEYKGNGHATTLMLRVVDGMPPFHLTVDWGDGTRDQNTYDAHTIPLNHEYTRIGKYQGRIFIKSALGSQELFFAVNITSVSSKTSMPGTGAVIVVGMIILVMIAVSYRMYHSRIKKHS